MLEIEHLRRGRADRLNQLFRSGQPKPRRRIPLTGAWGQFPEECGYIRCADQLSFRISPAPHPLSWFLRERWHPRSPTRVRRLPTTRHDPNQAGEVLWPSRLGVVGKALLLKWSPLG